MDKQMKKQFGFSLVELVIIFIVIGLLMAAALPKFLEVRDEAKKASIEAVAGGYSTAVLSARAHWEAEGRPSLGAGNNRIHYVEYDGVEFWLTRSFGNDGKSSGFRDGYPTALKTTGQTSAPNQISSVDCINLMENLLQNPPRVGDQAGSNVTDLHYTAQANLSDNTCVYVQQEGSDHQFVYEIQTGRVTVELQ